MLNSTSFAYIALIIAMVSIQFGAAAAKQLFQQVGPEGVTSLRLVLAALMLSALWRPWRVLRQGGARSARAVLSYGLALGTMNFLFYQSLQRIPLGVAVTLEFAGPLALAVMQSRRALDFLWVCLAGAGILLLIPSGSAPSDPSLDPMGVAAALGAGAAWAIYIVRGQRLGQILPGPAAAALGMTTAAVLFGPVGIIERGMDLLSPAVLRTGLLVAVFSSALPYSLEMIALRRLPTFTFGILMSLEPVIAALAGFALLGETLHGRQWLAIGSVVAASIGSSISHALRPKTSPTTNSAPA